MNKMTKKEYLGDYKILETIGSGGFGTVYKVQHPDGEIFAAKVPKNKDKKFKDEVSALEGLFHPNIIGFRGAHNDSKQPFYLMEYVPEGSIEKAKKPVDLELSLIIMHQILQGLKYAHEKGIIHGDLKPSNILLGSQAMISDFGLVSKIDPGSFANTLSKVSKKIAGTLDYMSPEQKKGIVDKRNDIYSAGLIFYNILTNRLLTNARKPSEINRNIPESIDKIVLKALADIDERYQTAKEFCDDVGAMLKKNPKSRIKDCLSGRYVPSNLLPKEISIYNPGIAKAIAFASSRLEDDLARKAEQAIGANDKECRIISKEAKVKTKNYTIKQMKQQYCAVEISDDSKEYIFYNGSRIKITPHSQGFKMKRAIDICKANNDWDVAPEEGPEIFHPKKESGFKEPVWYYPQNRICANLDIDVSVRYEIKRKIQAKGKELKSAYVKQVWSANKRYSYDLTMQFSGSDNFVIALNPIKLDDLVLKSENPAILYSARPDTPFYVSIPAGIIPFGLSALIMPDFLTGAIACPIISTLSSTLASVIYRRTHKEEINERAKLREKEKEEFRRNIANNCQRKVSIETAYMEILE